MENISRETARGIRVSRRIILIQHAQGIRVRRGGYRIIDEIRVAHGPFNTSIENISTSSGVRAEWG